MGILKKGLVAILLLVFFTLVFAYFAGLGMMNPELGTPLYYIIFFSWIYLEVVFSTM